MSHMYSLLNHIAATSKEIYDGSSVSQLMFNPLYDHSPLHSAETDLHGLSEDQKKLVGISTISVVTRLALEFHTEEVSEFLDFSSYTFSTYRRLSVSLFPCFCNDCNQLNPPSRLP